LDEISFQKILLRNVIVGSAGIKIIDKISNKIIFKLQDYEVITLSSINDTNNSGEVKKIFDEAVNKLAEKLSENLVSKINIK
jgi:hypothetical protein